MKGFVSKSKGFLPMNLPNPKGESFDTEGIERGRSKAAGLKEKLAGGISRGITLGFFNSSNRAEMLEVLRQVKVNIPLLDMIKQVPTYAKKLKDLCTVKRGLNVDKKAFLTEQVSAIIQCKTPVKYKDPGCLTILVNIGGSCVEKALLDLGASVNLLYVILTK